MHLVMVSMEDKKEPLARSTDLPLRQWIAASAARLADGSDDLLCDLRQLLIDCARWEGGASGFPMLPMADGIALRDLTDCAAEAYSAGWRGDSADYMAVALEAVTAQLAEVSILADQAAPTDGIGACTLPQQIAVDYAVIDAERWRRDFAGLAAACRLVIIGLPEDAAASAAAATIMRAAGWRVRRIAMRDDMTLDGADISALAGAAWAVVVGPGVIEIASALTAIGVDPRHICPLAGQEQARAA